MFYAHFVLSKKGPLAKIWLAAHWDKKLTKAHVFETSIEGSVEAIIQPKAKIALRTSGHLLLGVVRIYSRKAKYLLADCNEAFVKIKMAFRPGVVDLPEENREAAVSAITLPEAFHDFDMAELGDLEVPTQFALNQSRPEEITMKEDLGTITLLNDDGFGDMGFDGGLMDDSQLDDSLIFSKEPSDFATLAIMAMQQNNIKHHQTEDKMEVDKSADEGINEDDLKTPQVNDLSEAAVVATGDDDDDYEGPAGCDDDDYDSNDGGRDSPAGDLFVDNNTDYNNTDDNMKRSEGGLFEDPIMCNHNDMHNDMHNDIHNDMHNDIQSDIHTDIHNELSENNDDNPVENEKEEEFINTFNEVFSPSLSHQPATPSTVNNLLLDPSMPQLDKENSMNHLFPLASPMPPPMHEPETFLLKSLHVTHIGHESKKYRKKRKLMVDEQKCIASETMKLQLSDTCDIVTTLDLAPPTKKLMLWKETGGVEKLTSQPGRCLVSKRLIKIISANLLLHHDKPQPPLPPPPPSSPSTTTPDNLRCLSSHPDELEVRSKIGADGNPRLVFALKKKSSPSNNTSSQHPSPQHPSPQHPSPQHPSPQHPSFQHPSPQHISSKNPSPQHQSPQNSVLNNNSFSTTIESFDGSHNNNNNINNNKDSVGQDIVSLHNNLLVDVNQSNNNPNNNKHLDTDTNNNNLNSNHSSCNNNSIQQQQQQISDDLKWQEVTNKLKDNMHSTIITPTENSLNNNNYDDYDDDNGDAYDDDDYGGGGHDDDDTSHNKSGGIDEVEEEEEEEEEDEEETLVEAADEKEFEEMEEKRWNKRSHQMLSTLNKLFTKGDKVGFHGTISRCNRKQVSSKFYSLLVLKKTQTIEVHQSQPYSDIILTKGPLYSFP